MRISTNNLVVMGCLFLAYIAVNYLIASDMNMFFGLLLIQLAFIGVAISPVGEAILRNLYGGGNLTKKEADYLMPLFNEVYDDVKAKYPKTNANIKLYIEDSMELNAFALGTRTISITRGSMEMLSDDEIKGLFAHEFGHLSKGDTLLPLIILIGNFMFFAFMIVFKVIQFFVVLLTAHAQALWLGKFVNLLATACIALVMFIAQALVLINQRQNEYSADKFAYDLGYGQDLIDVLYNIKEMEFGFSKEKMMDKIKSSHPNTRKRIERLENMDGLEFQTV